MTPQESALPGDTEEDEHEDNLNPLDVKLVKADIEVTRKQPVNNMAITTSARTTEK